MALTLSFSTLACPDWDLERILAEATAAGYGALELRGYLDQMDLPLAAPFTENARAATRRRIEDAGLWVCCIGSSGIVGKGNADHVASHCALAVDLGCPLVRIFGGERNERSAQTLRRFGDIAADAGVALVLETHDSFSTGESAAALIAEADHPSVFSLWDFHHPYRQGEAPEETCRLLAPTLRHIHVKDSRDGVYTLLGDGDIPTQAMLDLALASGYDGAISVEWEKRWHPELPDPALALPQHADALRRMLGAALA